MRDARYSSTDPETGNVTYRGSLSLEKGDHSHMPSRTGAYLPDDHRGHVNASSLGGVNTPENVVAQSADLNTRGYKQMEGGERQALKNGCTIHSEKIAYVNGQPGDRPSAFMVNDTITYPDGHTETVHLSFANASYAEQDAWNEAAASLPVDDSPNPGDGLRESMSPEAYAELMEATEAELPGIQAEYEPADYSGMPDMGTDSDISADTDADSDED